MPKQPSHTETPAYAALLRGINVGGKHKLPMADLRDLFAEAGGTDVRTYIQSGNVVFRAPEDVAARLPALVEDAIAARHGFSVPLVLRRAEALASVVADNPFLAEGADPAALHVAFLQAQPTPAAVRTLDPDRSPPDRFKVQGQEVYLHCPNGLARTRLTADYFDHRLETVATFRNWRTVQRLVAMAAE